MAALSFAFVFALIRSIVLSFRLSICLSACLSALSACSPVWPFIFLIFAQDQISCTFACHVFICFSSLVFIFCAEEIRKNLFIARARGPGVRTDTVVRYSAQIKVFAQTDCVAHALHFNLVRELFTLHLP